MDGHFFPGAEPRSLLDAPRIAGAACFFRSARDAVKMPDPQKPAPTEKSRLGRTSPQDVAEPPGFSPEALRTWPHQNWALCLPALVQIGNPPGMPG